MSEVLDGVNADAGLVFPDVEWRTAPPEAHGLDAGTLETATRQIFEIEKRYGFLVVKNGVVVHEHYSRGAHSTNHIFSLTKGLGATLVGIAQRQGLLHVEDLVADWLPVRHPDIADGARIKHLLNMTASRSPVGSCWQYNSAEILKSVPAILWHASGMPPVEFYERYLRAPLGLSFAWPSNARGWIQIGSRGPLPVIEAHHRDIARPGLLWMNRGTWAGTEIMSPGFVDEALRSPYPEANGAYGYLWWLNAGTGTWRTTGGRTGTGRWFPGAPETMFLGLGARGKVMVVLPDEQLIAVTMGETPQEQSHSYLDRIVENVVQIAG